MFIINLHFYAFLHTSAIQLNEVLFDNKGVINDAKAAK